MAQNIATPADRDEIYTSMERLLRDSQVVRSAHFIAAQRKDKTLKFIGVSVILVNVLITSGLVEAAVTDQKAITISIKLLAFLAAGLAGIQGYFNFQKTVECHTRSGNVYSSLYRRINWVMSEYASRPANRDELIKDFEALSTEYLKANDDAATCFPSDGDYKKARKQMETP